MAEKWGLLLLAVAVAAEPIQLVHSLQSQLISSTSTPLTFLASDDTLFRCSYTSSFSLSTWVKFYITPAVSQPFVTVKNANLELAVLEKLNDGSVRAKVSTSCSNVILSLSGPVTPKWSFVALSVCSYQVTRATLFTADWQGTMTSTFGDSVHPFLSFDPSSAVVQLGGDVSAVMTVLFTQGQFLDTQFECSVCRTSADISLIFSSTTCYSKCSNGCSGPGNKACNDYIQLIDEASATSITKSTYFSWGIHHPLLEEKTFSSPDCAYSGWYYETTSRDQLRIIFRAQNAIGDGGAAGNRNLFVGSYNIGQLHFSADGPQTLNQYKNSASVVCVNQPSSRNKWIFVAAYECAGTLMGCFGFFTSTSLTCTSRSITGGTIPFGTSSDSKLIVGDSYTYGSIDGKVADQKYYPNACKSQSDLEALFLAGKQCMKECQTCSSAFYCQLCVPGYYLSSNTCKPCNSCCLECSGAGNANCITCSSYCVLIAPKTCISTLYSGCPPNCATCTGRLARSCLTCKNGYALQPLNSQECFSTCPSGYSNVSGVCTGTDQTILDYRFDQIKATIEGVGGQKAVNGASTAYFPPNFEASDPLPSKERGFYFSGSQYVQLPPAASTAGLPTILTPSLTFTAWIRPKGTGTVYSKREGCIDIFRMLLSAFNTLQFIGGSPTTTYTHTQPLSVDLWVFITVTFSFDSTSKSTTITFYYDGIVHATTFSANFIVLDSSSTASQTIGASSDLSDFYVGYIWRVTIRNYVWTTSSSEITSPGCPSGLSFCLSTSLFLQTADGLDCLASCTSGCVRTADCSYCQDPLCYVCPRFDTMECTACTTGATFTTQCTCDFGRYFKSATNTCELCSAICNGCSSPTVCLGCYAHATLSLGTCTCDSSYYPNPDAANCQLCNIECATCSSAAICLSCKTNAIQSGSTCTCINGCFPSPDASNCIRCNSLCVECTGGSASNCLACAAHGRLASTAPSSCECVPGYFPLPDVSNCQPCSDVCATCSSFSTCLKCKANADLSGSSCICSPSTFPSPNASNCVPCHNFCSSCTASSENDCLTCWPGASLAGTAPNSCLCDSGLTEPPDNCGSCDITCRTCTVPDNANKCVICKFHAHLSGTSPSECVCNSGYFPSPDAGSCQPCHHTCLECTGGALNQCSACFAGYLLLTTAPSVCGCHDGFFLNSDTGNCEACHNTCKTCTSPAATSCTHCLSGAELSPANSCICSSGFYTTFDSSTCLPCSSFCSKCAGAPALCSECKPRAHLARPAPSNCECDAGFYPAAGQCSQCDISCVACNGGSPSMCTSCDNLSNLYQGMCICVTGYYRSGSACTACSSDCLECVTGGTSGCKSCSANAALTGKVPSECKCIDGYRRNGSTCIKCVNYFAASSLKAQIASTFMTLAVTFPVVVSTADLTSCDAVFAPASLLKLGEQPLCVWATDAKSLNVQLGKGFTLRNEEVTLMAANIGSVEGDCTAKIEPLKITVTYESPRKPPTPVITAPSIYSIDCGAEMKLSASSTFGLGGQSAQFRWQLTLLPSQTQIAKFSTYAASNQQIKLQNSELSGDRLNATLYVKDSFGTEAATSEVISLSREKAILVSIDAVSPVLTTRSRPLKVAASAKLLCSTSESTFSYQWTQLAGNPVQFSPGSYQLFIEANQLTAGTSYTFGVAVSDGDVMGSTSITVKVLSTPITVSLDRSDGQQDSGQDLVIDAKASFDPDNSEAKLKFSWQCAQGTSPCVDKNGKALVLASTPVLTIKSEFLKPGSKLAFTLTVASAEKFRMSTVSIEVIEPVSLGLKIQTETKRVPPGVAQIVYPTITATGTIKCEWKQVSGKPATITTPLSVPWIKVGEGQIKSGESYKFALTITKGKESMTQYLVITANMAPAFGQFSSTPTTGEAIADDFLLEANQWDDPDGGDYPLTYQFGVQEKNGKMLWLSEECLQNSFSTYFFPGELTLIVNVCDSLKACTSATTSVSITKMKRQLDDKKASIIKKFQMATKDPPKIPAAVINFARSADDIDQEIYTMMLSGLKDYTNSLQTIVNSSISTQLSACSSLAKIPKVMTLPNLRSLSEFIIGTLAVCEESLSDANIKASLGMFTDLMGRSGITSEIVRYTALVYAFVNLVPGDVPQAVKGDQGSTTASRVLATDPKNLNIVSDDVKLAFPPTFLTDLAIPANSIVDLRVTTFNAPTEASPTISVTLGRSGEVLDNNLKLSGQQAVSVFGLSSPISLTIPMNNVKPGMSYEALAMSDGGTKWTRKGVNLASMAQAISRVSVYHFSSFKVVERKALDVELAEWPDLMEKSSRPCGQTYSPIILALLETVVLAIGFAISLLIPRKPEFSRVLESGKITPLESFRQYPETPPPEVLTPRASLIRYNVVCGFAAEPVALRLAMAVTLMQSEVLALGIANLVRTWNPETSIADWSWEDFICCLVALAVGEVVSLGLLVLYFRCEFRAKLARQILSALLACLSLMMVAGTIYLATTGCDEVLNLWTAEAIAVLIVEVIILSWANALAARLLSKVRSLRIEDSKEINNR